MPEIKDDKPFPIMAERRDEDGNTYPKTFIPWWLAEMAYVDYKRYGSSQTLERLAERGGFSRMELVNHLRCANIRGRAVEQWDSWRPGGPRKKADDKL